MSSLRRIIGNTVISLAGQAVTWTSTLLLTMAYGRYLGAVKFGELYFALTFILLIGIPLEYSFNTQITRDVAQESDKASRYFWNVLLMKGVLWIVSYSVALVACKMLGYSGEEQALVAICGLTLLTDTVDNTARSLHYAFERVSIPVVSSILEKGLGAAFGVLLLSHGAGVQVMAFVLFGSSLIGALWQTIGFFRHIGFDFALDLKLMRELTRTSIPFLIYGVLGVVYARIDVVLLSLMTNDAVVGWYGAGYRLFDTLSFLPAIVVTPIMYPIYSKLSVASEESLKLAVEKSMNFLLFLGIPLVVGLIVIAPNVVSFLYQKPEFSHTIPALQALAPGVLFLYMNTALGNMLVSLKKEKKIPIIAGLCLVFNLGLNLLFIPVYQHVAAAAITSLTELLILCVSIVFLPKRLLPVRSLWTGIKSFIASVGMAIVILPLHTLNLFAIIPVAMLAYFGIATLLRTIPRQDIEALYKAIRSKKQQAGSVETNSSELETPVPSYELPLTPLPSYYDDSLFNIELITTMKMPTIHIQKVRQPSLKAIRLQPVEQQHFPQQDQLYTESKQSTGLMEVQ